MGPLSRMAALCRHTMWPGLRLLRAVAHLLHMSRVSPGRLLTRLLSDASREQIRDCSPGHRLHLLPRSSVLVPAELEQEQEVGMQGRAGKVQAEEGLHRSRDAGGGRTPHSLCCVLCAFGQAGLVSVPHKLTSRTHGPRVSARCQRCRRCSFGSSA